MKNLKTFSILSRSFALTVLISMAAAFPTLAQTYETSLTSGSTNEDFDELGQQNCSAGLPAGWVMAEGVGLPKYGGPINTTTTNWTTTAPVNYTNYTILLEGGASGCPHDLTNATYGGRVNLGDVPTSFLNRSIGFQSANPTWEAPTNDIMYGFYNNTGSNIVSLAITNDFKQYRLNTTAATVTFYYSYDGTNWTHLSAGDAGPFATGSSTTYYWNSGPLVTGKNFSISGLNISNGSPFYLDWHFIMANSSGSFSPILGLDDFGLTATFGVVGPVGESVWTAGSGNWATAGNWLGNTLPASGNSLSFAGAGGASVNNLGAVTTGTGTLGFVLFTNGAGSYTLSGNPITLSEGITNNSSAAQTLSLPITLTVDETFDAASSSMTFGGPITNGGNDLIFGGANAITFSGSATGAGPLTMNGTGLLAVSGSNGYTGLTTINSGTLQMESSGSISNSLAVNVATGATFDLTNNSPTIGALEGNGNVTLGSGTLTLADASGSFAFGGAIYGSGGLSVTGGFTETINATNYYTGPTLLASGTLAIANVATLGSGQLLLDGGTLQLTGTRGITTGVLSNDFVLGGNSIVQNTTTATAGTRELPFGGDVIATNGTLTVQNIATGNYTNVMYLRFSGPVTNFTQAIIFDSSLAGSQINNLSQIGSCNTNGTPPQVFSGTISGDGYFIRDAAVAGTGGLTILSGQNTFTWDTLVDHGYIGIGADSTMSGTNVLSSPVGLANLQINDDTIDGMANVGIFAAGGPHVLGNKVVLNGVTNTAIIGTNELTLAGEFDIGGIGKILTVSNTALTTISGNLFNTGGLTKAGLGVLELTADNTVGWSGAMTVAAGTLLADNPSGSATGSNAVAVSGGILAGTGTVAGAVVATSGGVSPGNPIGILTLNSGLDVSGGGAVIWTLGSESTTGAGTSFSQLAVAGGTLNLGGSSALTIQFTNSASAPVATDPFWQTTETWPIVTLSGGAVASGGNFTTINNGVFAAGTFATTVNAGGVNLTFTPGSAKPPAPGIASFSLSGSQLSLVVSNGVSGHNFFVLTATNLLVPLTNWTPVLTNIFSGNGTYTNTLTLTNTPSQRFYSVSTY